MIYIKANFNAQKPDISSKPIAKKLEGGTILEQVFFYWDTPAGKIPFLGLQRTVFQKDRGFDVDKWKDVYKRKYNQASQDAVDDVLYYYEHYLFTDKSRKDLIKKDA